MNKETFERLASAILDIATAIIAVIASTTLAILIMLFVIQAMLFFSNEGINIPDTFIFQLLPIGVLCIMAIFYLISLTTLNSFLETCKKTYHKNKGGKKIW